MTIETKDLPGFWRFVWLFFIQPITLHRLLSATGIDPDESARKLLRGHRSPQEDWWLRRSIQTLAAGIPAAFVIAVSLQAAGIQIRWPEAAVGVAPGVTGSATAGVASGVAVLSTYLLIFVRIPIYLLEVSAQIANRLYSALLADHTWNGLQFFITT